MKRNLELVLGLIFTFLIIAFSQVSLAAGCDTLKPGQAAFFQHGKFKGTCVVRNTGRYSNAKAIGIGNDRISSIKMGSGTQVRLCIHNNFKGRCETYTTNMASIGNMNDKTSSTIIVKTVSLKKEQKKALIINEGDSMRCCSPNEFIACDSSPLCGKGKVLQQSIKQRAQTVKTLEQEEAPAPKTEKPKVKVKRR
jgi:hypothetical protein